jgi:3-deoxy-manno-octulosonate cytidylyltransferase (CMP-KDO synthetase)
MKICGVIPIRLDSRRFPGKGLAKLADKEIILHVYDRAAQYRRFSRLIVATDNQQISSLIKKHGGEVFFSEQRFRNGSERVAAAVKDCDCDICVNIQGDEVFITAEAIDKAVELLERQPALQVATAVFPAHNGLDLSDSNLVKVKLAPDGTAAAFSREPFSGSVAAANFGHVGIYAFRKRFLERYSELEPTADELAQSLEQLRILGHGYQIGAALLDKPLLAINTPLDLEKAEELLIKEGG